MHLKLVTVVNFMLGVFSLRSKKEKKSRSEGKGQISRQEKVRAETGAGSGTLGTGRSRSAPPGRLRGQASEVGMTLR